VLGDPYAFAPVRVEGVQFGLGRLLGRAVAQSTDHAEKMAVAIARVGRVQPQRQPDLRLVIHEIGCRRHDANDFARSVTDLDRLADDRPSSKRGLPQLVRENNDEGESLRLSGHPGPVRFSSCEQSALSSLNAERLEQLLVYECRTHAQSSVAAGDIHFECLERSHNRE
jgi:hypothetical protein